MSSDRQRDKEALEELIQSEGWTVFAGLVAERFDLTLLYEHLIREAKNTKSMEELGISTTALLLSKETADQLMRLPYDQIQYLEELESNAPSRG